MEHLSPGSKVKITFHPRFFRNASVSGIACAPAVGHDCGAVVGQDCASVVGPEVAVGAAQPAMTSINRMRVKPRIKFLLWFIIFSSFRFLNKCIFFVVLRLISRSPFVISL